MKGRFIRWQAQATITFEIQTQLQKLDSICLSDFLIMLNNMVKHDPIGIDKLLVTFGFGAIVHSCSKQTAQGLMRVDSGEEHL